jgi:hypothetical protein
MPRRTDKEDFMTTTLANNQAALAALRLAHSSQMPIREPGTITFAGAHWPSSTTGSGKQIKSDVETAMAEARALVLRGYQTAKAALRGDTQAVALMTKWFGARPTTGDDWWTGVDFILTRLNQALLEDISVYYRGADALGKTNDYPGHTGNLTATDVSGYAETYAGTQNLIIGLCSVFFRRDPYKSRTIKLTGFDSVGGVLVHEMSHNLCNTDDHSDTAGAYYGTRRCEDLATNLPREAWYNADNIEYFCEEAYYGVVAPRPTHTGGDVTLLTGTHEQAATDSAVTRTSTVVVGQGGDVTGLKAAHEQAAVDSAKPKTSTEKVSTGVNVKDRRSNFEKDEH